MGEGRMELQSQFCKWRSSLTENKMKQEKIENRNVRKITKVGGGKTYSVTIPIKIIREFGLQEGQKLVVEKYGKGKRISIEDWMK
jgi:hypothetical protein